jgi:hypothetical protein
VEIVLHEGKQLSMTSTPHYPTTTTPDARGSVSEEIDM